MSINGLYICIYIYIYIHLFLYGCIKYGFNVRGVRYLLNNNYRRHE
jgi:hypothetical protein